MKEFSFSYIMANWLSFEGTYKYYALSLVFLFTCALLLKAFFVKRSLLCHHDCIDNRSLQYNIDKDGSPNYPDENFAREILQLFSVGLYQLNMDGSTVYKENGNPADTYSIDDIVSYSRGWTGFVMRSERGGAATSHSGFQDRTLDPMMINIDKRDWFPKTNLVGGFIVSRLNC